MRINLKTLSILVFLLLSFAFTKIEAKDDLTVSYIESEIRQRLTQIDIPVSVRYNSTVRSYIKSYVKRKRDHAEVILGRSMLYFPIFERALKKYNLPEALKYLPVLESALNPHAVSRSGAVGLWQFMPRTGKSFGLEINSYVDERKDPYKATDAAVKYLAQLYDRFGDWNIALAAYNCGPTKVSNVMKKAKSKNYHTILKYLPKETKNYVSAYIAASYLMKYYQFHDLNPQYPDYDLQFTETILIHQYSSFKKISLATGVPIEIIAKLNPSFNNGAMPYNRNGNYLTLPMNGMFAYRSYYDISSDEISYNNAFYDQDKSMAMLDDWISEKYIVQEGDTLESLAQQFNINIPKLVAWNNLEDGQLIHGQLLTIYINKDDQF